MSGRLFRRRGTAMEAAAFVGAEGEFGYDKTNKRIIAFDGVTAGGFPAARLDEVPLAPSPHGAAATFQWIEQQITCAGATTAIPLGGTYIIQAIALRVVTTVTGCTSITINDSQNGNGHWGSGISLSAGTTNQGVASPGPYYNGSTTLALAAIGGGASFTGGTVRVAVLVLAVTPPTS